MNARPLFAESALLRTPAAARALLGAFIEREGCVGRIVETEAYLAKGDAASHSHSGETRRNRHMFGPPGTCYVYFTYGMHHCFNVVTGRSGLGEAVLVRAIAPVEGIEAMRRRRAGRADRELGSGPARLVQALGILPEESGASLLGGGPIRLLARDAFPERFGTGRPRRIRRSTRIGISRSAELELRFAIDGDPNVSRA